MTVYTDTEASVHSGSPVEVYRFTGTFKNYYYTSAERTVTVNGQAYTVALIKRNAITAGTQEDDNLQIELEMPYDLELAVDYAFQIAPPALVLEVLRYHEGTNPASDWIVYWKGPVTSWSVEGHIAKALVPSIFSVILKGEIPSVYYHNPCNHRLYDTRCSLVASSFKQDTTIVAVDNSTIEVADDGYADSYLKAGEIVNVTRGERRLIVDNIADVLTIAYPFANAQVGDSVTLYVGCDHSFSTCKNKFSNSINYGGFPFVPTDNPFESEL
jgi:hypothetical protein